MTFTTPGGSKVRCVSHRRFFVVQTDVEFDHVPTPFNRDIVTRTERGAAVAFRTDSLDKARKAARKATGRSTGSRFASVGLVFDSVKGEFV